MRREDMDTRAISKEEAELVISKISTVLGQEDIPVCATGAFRRGEDIADEVDIVVLLNSEEKQKWFQRWMRTLFDTHGRYTNGKGTGVVNGVKLRFHPATPEEFGAMVLSTTGSGTFRIVCRAHAKARGYKLSQYGMYDRETDKRIQGVTSEDEILTAIGLERKIDLEERNM